MTKGIAQRLIDGSTNIDRMKQDIVKIIRMMRHAFEREMKDVHYENVCGDQKTYPTQFEIVASPEYFWRIYPHYSSRGLIVHGRKFGIIVLETDLGNDEIQVKATHVQEVHAHLDDLVIGMFDTFHILATHLTFLIKAGK